MTAKTTQMLTTEGVAEVLDISVEHARRLIRRGELAAVNIASASRPNYRVTPAALDQYLRDHAVAS
ncbi:MAG TPA: helix-turn-helix domain-containing protein [Kribbella sp.]